MTRAKMVCQSRLCKIIAFFVVFWLLIACYKADTTTSFFGKDKDVCHGENCEENQSEDGENIVDKGGVDSEATLSADLSPDSVDTLKEIDNHKEKLVVDAVYQSANSENIEDDEINVIITFTNAQRNQKLQRKFQLTVSSMLQHASVPLAIHVIGDPESQKLAAGILEQVETGVKYRVSKRRLLLQLWSGGAVKI